MVEPLTKEEMDANAEEAQEELYQMTTTSDLQVFDVARWWKRWYMKCGHKRLGRILLKFVPEES